MLELKKEQIRQLFMKSSAQAQIALDDDCIVKDQKPDVTTIVHTRGWLEFEEPKVGNGAVWVTGKVHYLTLYRCEGNECGFESLDGSIDFGEKIQLEGVAENDVVSVDGELEDLGIKVINSRKLAIRSLIRVYAQCPQTTETEIISGVNHDVQQKVEAAEILQLVGTRNGEIKVSERIELPNSNPNIARILYDNIEVRELDNWMENERLRISGRACVTILYAGEDMQTLWYETSVNVTGELDIATGDDPVYYVRLEPKVKNVHVAKDVDGEMRVLELQIVCRAQVKVWQEAEVPVLRDLYAPSRDLIPVQQSLLADRLLVKNAANVRICEQIMLTSEAPRILQLCSYEGQIQLDHMAQTENGIAVEGMLVVHVLYATSNDSMPLACDIAQIPFAQTIDVPGLAGTAGRIHYEIAPVLSQLQVNLMDNDHYEVKAVLILSAIVFEEQELMVMTDVQEQPLDPKVFEEQPGVIGYRIQPEESLWDIAKRYHTTEEELIHVSEEKILIVKHVEHEMGNV